jgi:hypothetical protein
MNSLTDAESQAQSDGKINFQSFLDCDEMVNFRKNILEENEPRAIVNFKEILK